MFYRLAVAAALVTFHVFPVEAACEDAITTRCLVEEIRAGLTQDFDDPFAVSRIRAHLARAELADGDEAAALAANEAVEQEGWREAFILPYARFLRSKQRESEALDLMRSHPIANAQGMDLLNRIGAVSAFARELSLAGDGEAARALLDRAAATLDEIPPNSMTLGGMVQIAEASDEIGESGQASVHARKAYDWFDTGALTLSPEEAVLLFRTLARFDRSDKPRKDAAETIPLLDEEGRSLYEGAIWTGVALGLQAREADASAELDLAVNALDEAPERAIVGVVEASLGPALASAGRGKEARDRLVAAAEAAIGSDPKIYAGITGPVATALIDIGERGEARRILDRLVADARRPSADGAERSFPLAFFAQTAITPYVRLGEADKALAIERDLAGRDGLFSAIALVGAGEFERAFAVLRDLDDDARYFLMAAIAEHLAYGEELGRSAP
ncbi:hypothetical protein [Afifella marina]|uniref:Tetratricopeptide repeat-containing protein n=2 Tax=Afifella marina TaxID=1080 RepID=A0A1G5MX85_AFIMA|nr:hypothetical protein [Afifella marina]MBK1622065.1 hypothetical protein [Afifella marina DSM 2698]MBK1627858.1 hypothetical protein [Afifella marina]MBK5918077.1 hypothetical protein [Afifella marina]RAI19852.1 hypothetical protein CH311_11100 [Afifella marina DSM 2698]SCZ29169.1 hypothetical protein SAMN03080610_01095 [Afifella marina DSM 2698]